VNVGSIAKRAGVGVVVAAATSGVAYGAERLVVARARRRDDPDAGRSFVPEADDVQLLDSHDGGTISVLRKGHGPTLVLCHGVTLSVRTWAKQFDSLPGDGFEIVAIDSRGHGDSRCGTTGHSVENLALDLRTALDALDVRDAILVGHSMGGIAVQAFAAQHPEVARERVRGLVLMSTLARTLFTGAHRLQALAERLADGAPDVGGLMARQNLGFLLARIGFGRRPSPSHVELVRQMIEACDAETTKLATRALLGLDLVPDIARIELPTLVMSGTADVITPPAESRRIAATIPGARLETFGGAGHMLMLERADEVDHMVVDFARAVGTGQPRREVS
jgi:pimeloyl-ACP methyl ester carboxylesterase